MTNSAISDSDFAKLLTQSRLTLKTEEQSAIKAQLNEAIEAIKVLSKLDTSQTNATYSASGLINVWREDIVTPSLSQAEALSNTKNTHNGYFVVPAIFDNLDN